MEGRKGVFEDSRTSVVDFVFERLLDVHAPTPWADGL